MSEVPLHRDVTSPYPRLASPCPPLGHGNLLLDSAGLVNALPPPTFDRFDVAMTLPRSVEFAGMWGYRGTSLIRNTHPPRITTGP